MSQKKIVAKSARDGYRRAGFTLSQVGTIIPIAELTVAQIEQLLDDPHVVVGPYMGEEDRELLIDLVREEGRDAKQADATIEVGVDAEKVAKVVKSVSDKSVK